MSTGSISLDILLNQIRNDAMAKTQDAVKDIRRRYPSLSQKEATEIHKMIVAASLGQQDEITLVVTAPPSFAIQSRVTKVVVDDMLNRANKSILITGYSLSDYLIEFDYGHSAIAGGCLFLSLREKSYGCSFFIKSKCSIASTVKI